MRSQRSASFMKWVERKIVTPFSRESCDQQFPESVPRDRVDAGGRLVEDQHLGFMNDGDRQREPLPDAQRQALGQGVGHRLEPETVQQIIDALVRCLFRKIEKARMQNQVLPHGQFGVERKSLGHETDPPARLDVAALDLLAEEQRGSFGRRQQTRQHLHRGRLAAAVGAEKAEDLAALDPEVDVIDRSESAESLGQAVASIAGSAAARIATG